MCPALSTLVMVLCLASGQAMKTYFCPVNVFFDAEAGPPQGNLYDDVVSSARLKACTWLQLSINKTYCFQVAYAQEHIAKLNNAFIAMNISEMQFTIDKLYFIDVTFCNRVNGAHPFCRQAERSETFSNTTLVENSCLTVYFTSDYGFANLRAMSNINAMCRGDGTNAVWLHMGHPKNTKNTLLHHVAGMIFDHNNMPKRTDVSPTELASGLNLLLSITGGKLGVPKSGFQPDERLCRPRLNLSVQSCE